MQKIVNVLAVSSAVVSLAVVGGGAYVFVNKDAIVEDVKAKVQDAVLGSLGGLGGGLPDTGLGVTGGGLPSTDLPLGTNDLATPSPTPQASVPSLP